MKKYVLMLVVVAGMLSCVSFVRAEKVLDHGLNHLAGRSAFWITTNGNVRFLLAFSKADVDFKNENWEGDEFNVYYELRTFRGKKTIMAYGDVDRGVVTAAYNSDPLDLQEGMFLVDQNGQVSAMTDSKKKAWMSLVGQTPDPAFLRRSPSVENVLQAEDAAAGPSNWQFMTPDDMDQLREERKDTINQPSPFGY